MATRTWNSSGSTDCNDGNNYSPTGTLLATDDLVFNSTSTVNCTLTANLTVNQIDVDSGYTGTFDTDTYNLTVSNAGFDGRGASFAVNLGSGSHVITGGFLVDSNTAVNGESSSVTMRGGALQLENGNFFDLTAEISSVIPRSNIVLNGTLTVDSTFDCDNFNNDFTFNGDVVVNAGGSWVKGAGTITLSGTANQSIDFDGETVEDIVVDKTFGTVTLTGGFTTDSLTCTAGTLDVNAQNITVVGDMTVAAGCTVTE